MRKQYFTILVLCLTFLTSVQSQEISEPKAFGVGLAYAFPAYGVSAKYNFTETHTGQIILGGASYGFGTGSFAAAGRYIYNLEDHGDFFIFRPYGYGQVGYFSVKYNILFDEESYNTVSFGVGGGIEFTFDGIIEGLYFNSELGYVSGSFNDGIGSFGGFSWGGGVHYRF